MSFRIDSFDESIFNSVYVNDEYNAPKLLGKDDVIIDVGAHIGSFSKLMLDRGAGHVMAFEPDHGNVEMMESNLSRYIPTGRLSIYKDAVIGSLIDRSLPMRHSGYSDEAGMTNTGGGNVFSEHGEKVTIACITDVIAEAAKMFGRVRLIKLDCEGSEWPIIWDDEADWSLVNAIVGEFHEYETPAPFSVNGKRIFNSEDLIERLRSMGFNEINNWRHGSTNLGLFSARRR